MHKKGVSYCVYMYTIYGRHLSINVLNSRKNNVPHAHQRRHRHELTFTERDEELQLKKIEEEVEKYCMCIHTYIYIHPIEWIYASVTVL